VQGQFAVTRSKTLIDEHSKECRSVTSMNHRAYFNTISCTSSSSSNSIVLIRVTNSGSTLLD
jgi:hypothetical protein